MLICFSHMLHFDVNSLGVLEADGPVRPGSSARKAVNILLGLKRPLIYLCNNEINIFDVLQQRPTHVTLQHYSRITCASYSKSIPYAAFYSTCTRR